MSRTILTSVMGGLSRLRGVGRLSALATLVAVATPAPAAAQTSPGLVLLPARLPAACIQGAADDFGLPATILLAMVKVESNGHSAVTRNANGTWDVGVAQHNTASWVPYFERRYGITAQTLADDPCQSIRAQAYVLRHEINSRECAGSDLWCAVARYHSPRNVQARQRYLAKVQDALRRMLASGQFEAAAR
jgi:soluble lytic murein transglycosylase-like protein